MKNSIKFAVLVRSLRNAFNLSQGALASSAGCSRPTINRLESLAQATTRMDKIDDVLAYFRELGVEVRIFDESVEICFTKGALTKAEQQISRPNKPEGMPIQ